jgi:flagellar basal-body rod protein FlgB
MNEISDSAVMAALGRQMTTAVAKQVVAAGNLANLDTPGYRTRDVSFGDLLADEVHKLGLTTTRAGQLPATGSDGPATTEVDGLQPRRDGNNVQLDRELMQMARASSDFSAAETAMAAKFRLIRYAINEGR